MEMNEIEFVEKNEIIEVRGKQIPVKYKERKCTKCGDFYSNVPEDDDPYDMAYRIYREKHNMTQPEDIKKLREKYGLTQAELGKLLDWGAVTLSRYENGALQDGSHQNNLLALEDPQFVLELINKRPKALPKQKIEYIKKLYQFNFDTTTWDNGINVPMYDSTFRECAA